MISSPLSSAVVGRLTAGDQVVLSGWVPLVSCTGPDAGSVDDWSAVVEDGTICCFLHREAGVGKDGWAVARLDEPVVDRALRSLLAAGARGFIAAGRCPATASYALRKYGGLFFAVGLNWLSETQMGVPNVVEPVASLPHLVAVLQVDRVALTVTHDSHGRQMSEPGSSTLG